MLLPSIQQISIYRHQLHFNQPAGTSRGVYLTRKLWLVVLESEDYMAVGECAPLPDLSCDALPDAEYEDKLKSFCLELLQLSNAKAQTNSSQVLVSSEKNVNSQDPANSEKQLNAKEQINSQEPANFDLIDNSQQLLQILPTEFAQKLQAYPSMLFAFESAILQLQAKSLVFSRSPFTCKNAGIPLNGLVWMGDFQQMYERLQSKISQGFRCIKLKIGAIDFAQELALLEHIRQHFSSEQIEIRVDANGAFSMDEAMDKLQRLSQFDLHSIEQPIKSGQWDNMRSLCQKTPLPIALDEELIGVNEQSQKIQLLETIKPQYIILKPSLHGGLSGAVEWIFLAQERGISSWITSALESNIGLCVIAQLAGLLNSSMPQGLGTGQLFTDNIDYPLILRQDAMYLDQEALSVNPPCIMDYLRKYQVSLICKMCND